MSTEYLKLILDVVILVGLGGFMYYALRLSKALDNFRTYRNEFENVMNQLSTHIDKAQTAVHELKSNSHNSTQDLRKLLKDSQFLADDLQMLNETGNTLANRLDGLLDKNRKAAKNANVSDIAKHRGKNQGGFDIQDREFEDNESHMDADELDETLKQLSSDAEKELYQALKKNGQSTNKRKA